MGNGGWGVEWNAQVHHSQTPHKVTIDSCNNQTIVYLEEIHKSLESYICCLGWL